MILIFGGSYQGKLAYTLERFDLAECDIYRCREDDPAIPKGKKVIYEIDKWLLGLLKAQADTKQPLRQFIEANTEAIVICNDISCGIVPAEAILRQWREAVGYTMAELSRSAHEVVRLYCGLPTKIK